MAYFYRVRGWGPIFYAEERDQMKEPTWAYEGNVKFGKKIKCFIPLKAGIDLDKKRGQEVWY